MKQEERDDTGRERWKREVEQREIERKRGCEMKYLGW